MTGPIRTRLAASLLLRSLIVQASWNYRTLLGTGFAFVMLPVLRSVYQGDPDGLRRAVYRHATLFNSHPYLAPLALGAVARLETEHEDPLVIDRFKIAVRGSLGTLGDRLVWAGLRPVVMLFALLLFAFGAAGGMAAAVFLVCYNVGHIALRVWSLRLGLGSGKSVGERLRGSAVLPAQRLMSAAGAFLLGMLIPLAAAGRLAGAPLDPGWIAAGAIAAAVGVALAERVRVLIPLVLAVFTLFGFLLAWLA